MTDKLRETARAVADHPAFVDREFLSADLSGKLDALRAALAAAPQPTPADREALVKDLRDWAYDLDCSGEGPSAKASTLYAAADLIAAPQPAPSYEDLLDKIDGLESDLHNAVETAIKRGAVEWGRLNYPNHPALRNAPQPAPDREALVKDLRDWAYDLDCSGEGPSAKSSTLYAAADLIAAPQPAPADREALVDVIRSAIDGCLPARQVAAIGPRIADALLARGLRLPGGEETMAWAVVGAKGLPMAELVTPNKSTARAVVQDGERVARVAIRVVVGGDDE